MTAEVYNASWAAIKAELFKIADEEKFSLAQRAQLTANLQRVVEEKGLSSHVAQFYSQLKAMDSEVFP